MIRACLKMMRIYYALPITGGFIVIVAYLTGSSVYAARYLLLSSFSLFCVIAGGYILNDVCDIEIDRINFPQRPLVSGATTVNRASIVSASFFAVGLSVAGCVGLKYFAVLGAIAIGMVVYDLFSKRLGFFKDILVASLMVSLYPLAFALTEAVATGRAKSLFVSPFWLFFTSLGYEMLKDVRDVKGDRRIFRSVIADYSGRRWFLPLARVISVFASILSIIPYLLGYCKSVYLGGAIVAIVLAIVSMRKRPSVALRYLYASIAVVASAAMADLIIFGP